MLQQDPATEVKEEKARKKDGADGYAVPAHNDGSGSLVMLARDLADEQAAVHL